MSDAHDIPERWTVGEEARKGPGEEPAPEEERPEETPGDAASGDGADEKEPPRPPEPRRAPATGRASRRELVDRSRSRAWALQVHYRWESAGGETSLRDTFIEMMTSRRIAKRRFPRIRRLCQALDDHLAEVDRALEDALDNWRLERLSSIDRGILRIGAVEILFMDDIPPKASIQEALGLAEAYGGSESPRFVNGVLDAIYRKRGREGG